MAWRMDWEGREVGNGDENVWVAGEASSVGLRDAKDLVDDGSRLGRGRVEFRKEKR